jgi:hypothetical protein
MPLRIVSMRIPTLPLDHIDMDAYRRGDHAHLYEKHGYHLKPNRDKAERRQG